MYQTIIVPRVSETDGAGHINNTTLPVWLEAGRYEIFKLFTPDLSFQNWKAVIAKTTLEFLNQIYYGQEVELKIWVKQVGNSSFKLYEEIHQTGKLCATNEVVYVNFNFNTQKSEIIPENIKKELLNHIYEES